MIALGAIALLSAFLCLVLASQLPEPLWRWALDGLALSLAVAALAAAGGVASRVRQVRQRSALVLSLLASATALASRPWLLEHLSPPEVVPTIDFGRLQLAALSGVAAAFALFGGAVLLARGGSILHLSAAGAALVTGLFTLGPLLLRLGVPVDHRAFLGLAGLGLGAFAVVEAARKVARR